ncbi:uncharacterized protein LOC114477713 [Gouania willdenowi]|uniref:Uncharacterized LOC114477713 n=1 Tax=Gouania willdenowi TaxID=441366 RepID=A0A8C5N2A4_GOUWI|nr:uncharacterized protein LOC114477713 [Gouania willdenowi]XP_028326008.1 uncharacterized protein LOC114477713 [Gouania willdenowi]XP_028326009.1 uncharacterized protein LOC114477713 [Gouania willdenowi]
MDFSLYPAAVSEYNTQRTVACFTVRSANSPLYSLTRRSSARERETPEEAGETERHVTNRDQTKSTVFRGDTRGHGSVRGQSEDMSGHKMTVQYNQNGRKETPEAAADLGKSTVFTDRGRTEWKGGTLSSRSMSVDWNMGQRSPDFNTTANRFLPLRRSAPHLSNNRTRAQGGTYGYTSHTLERQSSLHSLQPSLKTQPGTSSRFSESANSLGPQGGRSILQRIEKLYGSAGLGKEEGFSVPETATDSQTAPMQRVGGYTAGGTFPRRFSTGYNSPLRSSMSLSWTEKDRNTSASETSLSPRPSITRERSPGSQWQGQTWGRFSNGGSVTRRKGLIESGTKSLDRDRSKNTVAAQIRAARASEGITATQKPVDYPSGFYKDSTRLTERRASESKMEHTRSTGDETSEDPGKIEMFKDRCERFKTEEKAKCDRTKDKTELMNTDEMVFDTSSPKTLQRATERRTFPDKVAVASSASVRNKISQFEALTQRAHGLEAKQVPLHRRTLSVPTQLTSSYNRMSESTKGGGGLRKWEESKTEERASCKEKVIRTGRSLSVDDVGLNLEKKSTRGSIFSDDGKDKTSDYSNKHIIPKSVLEVSVNDRAQRGQQQLFIDETDFYKVSSSDEVRMRNLTASDTSSLSPTEVTSPVSDEDKTPTNTPDNSPFLPLSAKPTQNTPSAKSENKHTFVFTTPSPDTSALTQRPATSSLSGLPEPQPPAAKSTYTKGRKQLLDLEAWVTGLNPDYRSWSYNEEDFDDDDESTQKDEDSLSDSDSGESSVTITSSISNSDRKSFSLSLADLCSFTELETDTEDDNDEWQSSSRRSVSISSDISTLSSVSMIPSEELERLLEDVRTLGDNSLQDSDDIMVVVLHKEVGVGLGFSIAGGVDQNKPITVHKVFHSGVAAQEGSIKAGDQVLSINGSALQGSAHWEAHRVLRRAKAREMGVVVLRRDDVPSLFKRECKGNLKEPKQMQSDTGQCVRVQLQKNSRHLGFSLEGGADSSGGNQPLTVQKIFMGGPTNEVFIGDEIVEIQGVSMVGMRRLEAWTLIRTLPLGPVDVVLRRPQKCPKT